MQRYFTIATFIVAMVLSGCCSVKLGTLESCNQLGEIPDSNVYDGPKIFVWDDQVFSAVCGQLGEDLHLLVVNVNGTEYKKLCQVPIPKTFIHRGYLLFPVERNKLHFFLFGATYDEVDHSRGKCVLLRYEYSRQEGLTGSYKAIWEGPTRSYGGGCVTYLPTVFAGKWQSDFDYILGWLIADANQKPAAYVYHHNTEHIQEVDLAEDWWYINISVYKDNNDTVVTMPIRGKVTSGERSKIAQIRFAQEKQILKVVYQTTPDSVIASVDADRDYIVFEQDGKPGALVLENQVLSRILRECQLYQVRLLRDRGHQYLTCTGSSANGSSGLWLVELNDWGMGPNECFVAYRGSSDWIVKDGILFIAFSSGADSEQRVRLFCQRAVLPSR